MIGSAAGIAGADRLVERTAELALGRRALADLAAGRGRTLAIVGPAGIGKTALLAALCADADPSATLVLRARGSELERDFSFGVVRHLFEAELAGAGAARRERLLAGAALLAAPVATAAPRPGGHGPGDGFAALHGLYWLTANLARERPLLLAVDDAHWADLPSLRFLAYLGKRLEGLPVLLVACVRAPEPGVESAPLDALLDDPATLSIRPRPLGEAGVGRLVRDRFDAADAEFCRAVEVASGGNPFLLGELLADLAERGIEPLGAGAAAVGELSPPAISRSVLARLGRLEPAAAALARGLAICGEEAELRDVAGLVEVDPATASTAADALAAAGILAAGDRLRFVHPVVRTAIYGELPAGVRSSMHRRAARLRADRGADPEEVGAHLLASRPAGEAWAVARLREAAARALARGAPEAAANYLRRARAESSGPEDGELPAELGAALALAGERQAAIEVLGEALERLEDPRRRALATRTLAAALVVEAGGAARAVELLRAAIAALPAAARKLGASLEGDVATAGFVSVAGRRAARGHEPRFTAATDHRALAAAAMDKVLREGPAAAAAELARRALAGGSLLAAESADSATFWLAALALLWARDLDGAEAVMSAAMADAAARGSARGVGLATCFRAHARLLRGAVRDAEADARRSLELVPGLFAIGPAFLVESLLDQGRLEEAGDAVATDGGPGDIGTAMFHFRLHSRARLAIRAGRPEQGLAELRVLGEGFAEWGTVTPGPLQWRPLAVEALLALDRRDEARATVAAELRSARAFGAPSCLGVALRTAGEVEAGATGADAGERCVELLDEATRTLAPTTARLEYARASIGLGAARRRAGQRAASREPLSAGLAVARRCGATALAERAFAELEAGGARPRKILRSGVEALTPSELRVARMAADGRANRAIAEDLFVTVRTVETHLHSCFRKLDIGSRGELAAALGDHVAG